MSDDTTPSKACALCNVVKPLTDFYAKKSGHDGLTARCKACVCAAVKARADAHPDKIADSRKRHYARNGEALRAKSRGWRAANRDRAAARDAAYYAANREACLEKCREYRAAHLAERRAQDRAYGAAHREEARSRAKEWRIRNPQRALSGPQRWRLANPAKLRAYRREWEARNPHYRTVRRSRRRAAVLNARVNDFTPEQWLLTLKYFGHRCAYCGAAGVPLTQEHMVPLSRGGDHTAANIVPACKRCNSRKATRTPLEWLYAQSIQHGRLLQAG